MYSQLLLATSTTDTPSIWSTISSSWATWLPIILSVISIIVSIAALIKSAQATYLTRNPHLKMRVEVTRKSSPLYRLIIINEGSRSGIIDSLDLGPSLSERLSYGNLFDRIKGKELLAGQTIFSDLNPGAVRRFLKQFHKEHPHAGYVVNVRINYHNEKGKTFSTPSSLNFSAELETVEVIDYVDIDDIKPAPTTTEGKK